MQDTGTKCPTCTGKIMGAVENVPRHIPSQMPFGPISEENYELVVSFWCSNPLCGILFKSPPGQPDAKEKLLAKERARIAEVQKNW